MLANQKRILTTRGGNWALFGVLHKRVYFFIRNVQNIQNKATENTTMHQTGWQKNMRENQKQDAL